MRRPTAPTVTDPVDHQYVTADHYLFQGETLPGGWVTVYRASAPRDPVTTGTADSSGRFAIDVPLPEKRTYGFAVTVTHAAGNEGRDDPIDPDSLDTDPSSGLDDVTTAAGTVGPAPVIESVELTDDSPGLITGTATIEVTRPARGP